MIFYLVVFTHSYQFDPLTAQKMTYWAVSAYFSQKSIQNWSCQYCKRFKLQDIKVHVSYKYDIQAYIGYSKQDNWIIVAFRGTVNAINWVADFKINLVDYPNCQGCKVHKGFYQGYKGIQKFIISNLKQYTSKYNGANIYVTGHSLGAALAYIGGLDISKNFNQKVTAFYTLGQPRVGNKELANYAQSIKPIFRIVHDHDLVPHVPQQNELQILKYKHSPRQILYDQNMYKYKVCQNVGQDPNCSNKYKSYTMSQHPANFYIIKQIAYIEQIAK